MGTKRNVIKVDQTLTLLVCWAHGQSKLILRSTNDLSDPLPANHPEGSSGLILKSELQGIEIVKEKILKLQLLCYNFLNVLP